MTDDEIRALRNEAIDSGDWLTGELLESANGLPLSDLVHEFLARNR